MISAAVRSKAVVLLLFIHCLLLLPLFVGFCVGSLFFCAVLCVLSSFCHHPAGEERAGCFTVVPTKSDSDICFVYNC